MIEQTKNILSKSRLLKILKFFVLLYNYLYKILLIITFVIFIELMLLFLIELINF